jgi:hypothetical protein
MSTNPLDELASYPAATSQASQETPRIATPGAEVKEPRKQRKVEDREVGVSKVKKTSSGPAQVTPLQELIEGLRDQLQRSNELRAEWLEIFQQEMWQTQKTFHMKMNGMMESGAELNETMGLMKNSLEFKLREIHT